MKINDKYIYFNKDSSMFYNKIFEYRGEDTFFSTKTLIFIGVMDKRTLYVRSEYLTEFLKKIDYQLEFDFEN